VIVALEKWQFGWNTWLNFPQTVTER